jgi:pimeloyl-ACP methyl ester carboxylesterase/DNA-binding CsgD family transcriptional regulator
MKQQVRLLHTSDQINLAWTDSGRGMPFVKAANWLTHLQYDLESPVWRHWTRFFGEHFRYIRYDERGCGMSDWRVGDLSFPRWVEDLERIVEAAAIERTFALLGISQGAATSIAYAVRHPQRVSHLILYGGYAVGGAHQNADPDRMALYRAVQDVVRLGWGRDNPAFRQLFTSRFIPGGSAEQIGWFNELCRRTTTAENASSLLQTRGGVDVRELLPQVRVPTLVLHASHDQIAPLSQGKYLASRIPGAGFIELDSCNHVLLEDEPAWEVFRQAVLEFTGRPVDDAPDAGLAALTRRERAILALLCQGHSNARIGWALGISEKTVRNHLSHLYEKLGVHSRAEAIVLSQQGRSLRDS